MFDFSNGIDVSTGFIATEGYDDKRVMWREYVKEIFRALYNVAHKHPNIDIKCEILHNSNTPRLYGFDRPWADGLLFHEPDMLNVSVTRVAGFNVYEDVMYPNLKMETTIPYPIQRDMITVYINDNKRYFESVPYCTGPNVIDLWTCDLDDFDFVMDKITYGHNLMMGVYDRQNRPDYAIRDDVWIFLIALLRIFVRYNEGLIFVPQIDKEHIWNPMRLAPQFRK